MLPKAPLAECSACPLRSAPFVPGEGPDQAQVVLIGEAPARNEVRLGRPFVGQAGVLLDRVLLALGLERQGVYLTNAALCGGTTTTKDAALPYCRSRLIAEVRARAPVVVVPMGNLPTGVLTGEYSGIMARRGRAEWSEELGCWVLPTLHPAAILRRPGLFPDMVGDLRKALQGARYRGTFGTEPFRYKVINDPAEALGLLEQLRREQVLVFDIETSGYRRHTDEILCLVLSWGPDVSAVLPGATLGSAGVLDALRRLMSEPGITWVGHSAKFDSSFLLAQYGFKPRIGFDTLLAHYCLDERRGTHDLKTLCGWMFDAPDWEGDIKVHLKKPRTDPYTLLPEHVLHRYSAFDGAFTFRLYQYLSAALRDEPTLLRLHDELLVPAANAFVEIEHHGILVDLAFQAQLEEEYTQEAERTLKKLRELVGDPSFNPNSTQQVARFLYDKLGLRGPEGRSTRKEVLAELAPEHEVPALIVWYRHVRKMLSTYVLGVLEQVDAEGRVHTSFLLHGTECVTGDSYIWTRQGIRRVDEILPDLPESVAVPFELEVLGREGWVRTSHAIRFPRRRVVEVTATGGLQLRCTPEHPFWTERGWVPAAELTTEDFVLVRTNVSFEGPGAPPREVVYRTSAKPFTQPGTDDFAWLVGLYVAEGCAYESDSMSFVGWSSGDPGFRGTLKGLLEETTGLYASIDERSNMVRLHSKAFYRWFKESYPCGSYAAEKFVPEPYRGRALVAFLQGLYRGDGHVGMEPCSSTSAGVPRAFLFTASERLAVEVQQMHLALGVRSMRVASKQVHKRRGGTEGPDWRVITNGGEAVKLAAVGVVDLPAWKHRKIPTATRWAKQTEGGWWHRVRCVEDAGVADVYDFTVPGEHAFVANGFLVHNTGRLSSRDPNMQNIPRESKLRDLFIASPGCVLLYADYSQMELRVLTVLSQDPYMIEVYRGGRDLHTELCDSIWGPGNWGTDERMVAKAVNFGVVYGRSAQSMAADRGLGMTLQRAEAYIAHMFKQRPGVAAFVKRMRQTAVKEGVLETPFGRRRRFGLVSAVNIGDVRGQASNFPIQSTASDVTLSSVLRLHQTLPPGAHVLLTVHDSVLLEAPKDRLDEVACLVKATMEEVPREKLGDLIPWKVDVEWGHSWGNLTKWVDPARTGGAQQ